MNPEARSYLNSVQCGQGCSDSLLWSGGLLVRIMLHLFLLLVICTIPRVVFSQQAASGQISGQVTDQSGAVIPGAQIVARNTATNVASSTVSNNSGYYSLQLPIGTYNISATKTGFAELVQNNIEVTVGSNVGLNLALSVGATTTKVEVTATATPLLTPHETSVQTTVPSTLVSEVPVEVSGGMRNSADFLKLTPGYQGSAFSARLNGGVGLDQEVLIDGADVSPVGFGTGIQGNQMTVPSFAVKEFRVIGSNVDAQYGRTSTGAVTYVFKSGTNQLHGSVFEYNRNEAYDARNFFAAKRDIVRQNEFGAEVGGPIKKDKIFYYGYYDGFRLTQSNNAAFYSLLTPQMKNGDFTASGIPAIYDPATTRPDGSGGFTRDQFSCNGVLNVICPNRISPISNYFYSLFPDPNLSGLSNNFKGTSTSTDNSDQFLVKVDTNISATSRLTGSFSYMRRPTVSDGPFGPILSGSFGINHGDRAIVNWDKTISPSLLNHMIVSFNIWYFFNHQGGQQSLSDGSNLNSKAGLGGILDPSGQTTINAGGYFLGIGGNINKIAHTDAEIGDDLTWMHGSHQLQFGFNTTRFYTIGLQQAGGFTPFGSITFAPQETGLPGSSGTGFAVASYLIGNVDSGTFGQQPAQAWVMPYYALYAQDQWKIRHNLTLSYGLRWDYSAPITDRQDRIANFDPSLQNPGVGNLPGALVFAGSGSGRSGKAQFANAWYKGFGPRIGIAYSPSPNTVLRGSYGIMYDTNSGPAIFLNQQGFFTQATLQSLDGGVTPAFDWATGFPSVPLGPFFDPTFANGGSTSYMQPNGARLPIIQNFNVGIQHRFPGGIVVDASYVGTNAHHLLVGTLDYNQLNPQYLSLGSLLQSPANSLAAQAAGIQVPYPGFTGTVAQALRPFPQYQGITLSSDPLGNNTYNSLQIKAQKRYAHGLSFLVSYTLSKDLTDSDGQGGGVFLGGAQDYYNLRAEKAVAAADVPSAFVGSYAYDLPVGKGKLLNIENNIADKIFGEWTTSGIITVQNGTPVGINTELSLPAIGVVRPDVVSNQFYVNNSRGTFDPAKDLYLNPAAFAPPAPFTFGNSPRLFSQIRTFGLREWDVALRKRIPITEHVDFGIKMEFFNFLNTVNFGSPVTDINNPSFGRIFSAGAPRTGQLSGTISW
jgi:outer membrane receptor protein involved in Fe transport